MIDLFGMKNKEKLLNNNKKSLIYFIYNIYSHINPI